MMSPEALQVLEGLPVDVAVAVLRAAPGTFERNFIHLPRALRHLPALAEHEALATACMHLSLIHI